MKEDCTHGRKGFALRSLKHALYANKAKQCVQTPLRRYDDEPTAKRLWEKV